MDIHIITGVSKGLGESVAKQLIAPGNQLICLSRRVNQSLIDQAQAADVPIKYYSCDLNNVEAVSSTTEQMLHETDFSQAEKISLINNAGVVEPIKVIGRSHAEELSRSISVNLIAPMVLTNWFLENFGRSSATKMIINISSGAAKNPYHGWAAYCSSKAGLDMFTRTVAVEQKKERHPTTIISFSPGIMDTEMQGQIRSTDEAQFAQIDRFKDYKEKGLLRSPNIVAEKLLTLLFEKSVISGEVYDIKQLID